MRSFISQLLNLKREIKRKRLKRLLSLNETVSLCFDIGVSHYQNLIIEDYVHLGLNTKIHAAGGVKIGRGTIFGPNVTIYSTNHNFRKAECLPFDEVLIKKNVDIGKNVWIGGNVIIVAGTIIGEGAIIGAGSVVSGVIEACSIVAGNPCKVIGKRDEQEYNELKAKDCILMKQRFIKNKL